MSETIIKAERMYPHPSPILEDHVARMREDLALLEYAIIGALDQQGHSRLSDLQESETLLEGCRRRFQALKKRLAELEKIAAEIREKGVPSLAENMAEHAHELFKPAEVR